MNSSFSLNTDYPVYSIVKDGIIKSDSVGEGRLVPVLVLDADNSEVNELIKIHKGTPPGDADFSWAMQATLFSKDYVYLIIKFKKPMKINFIIKFDLLNQYSLIEGILQSRSFYFASGTAGDKIINKIENNIFVEVPELDFEKKWNNLLYSTLKRKMKGRRFPKKEIHRLTSEHIQSIRDFWNLKQPK